MRLLLDSHVFLWLSLQPDRLTSAARIAVEEAEAVYVSPVSIYEIDYKRRRDAELARMPDDLGDAVRSQDLSWLPIAVEHMRLAARLPDLHRDPWDRILVAQARIEGLRLVTSDGKLTAYDVPTLW